VIGLMALAGCDDGNVACNCPDKIHGNAPCGCGGTDCTCKQKFYTLDHYGIILEDRTNGLFTDEIKNTINIAIGEFDDTLDVKKIILVPGNSISKNDEGEYTIGVDHCNNKEDFQGAIIGVYYL
jgi:hypothetical protein